MNYIYDMNIFVVWNSRWKYPTRNIRIEIAKRRWFVKLSRKQRA